jgi:glutathione synthase/RimK-type ligase-like ATP-grasp enzyme
MRIVLATANDQPDITPSDRLYADALERRGCRVRGAPWNGEGTAFADADAIVIRSTWGYYKEEGLFRAWTESMASSTRLFNPIGLVRWNLRKDYVGELAAAGVRVPACHFAVADVAAIDRVFVETGWSRAVIKPAVGGGGYAVELVARDEVASTVARLPESIRATGVLVQEFLPEIADGELSQIFFDGRFSHAVRKRPRVGEFRVNSRFGATRSSEQSEPQIIAQGASALHALPELPLYARVDGVVRGSELIVLEVEVLEPALFMEFDPASAERFAEATLRRLG